MRLRVWPGRPYPLGATWDGAGVNFAIFSEHATKVELCLFDSVDATRRSRTASRCRSRPTWSGTATSRTSSRASSTATASTARTSRRRASLQPEQGRARSVRQGDRPRREVGRRAVRLQVGDQDDLSFDDRDNAAFCPLASVIDTAFTWGDDRPPRTPWHKTLIYEVHVKGFTHAASRTCPKSGAAPTPASPPSRSIQHLQSLGVTAVELLPVHYHLERPPPASSKGLTNYWGYNTLGFFAPARGVRVASSRRARACRSSRSMVRVAARGRHRGDPRRGLQPHREGNQMGPTLSFRGIDNASYYRLVARGPALLHGLHRLRQHAEHDAPARAAAHHGQPAVLGDRDARRRLPLRPGQHARPRAARGRTSSARSSTSSTRTRSSRR